MKTEELKKLVCSLFEFGEDKWFDYEDEFIALANRIENRERDLIIKTINGSHIVAPKWVCYMIQARPGYRDNT